MKLRLSERAEAAALAGFDEVVLATGVTPRIPPIEGIDHPKAVAYSDLLSGARVAGPRVAIIGAGGIGFDVAEFLVQGQPSTTLRPAQWLAEWGIDPTLASRGGIEGVSAQPEPPEREVWLLQRTEGALGRRLGKTTGWVHRATLRRAGVKMLGAVEYRRIDDAGLHIRVAGEDRLLAVDHVILCAGQESQRELKAPLEAAGRRIHLIGGADVAGELDAKRAIAQGCELAAAL